jgi:EmrB/QacA subfamily drug resistance transporter
MVVQPEIGTPFARRWQVLGVCGLGLFMTYVDTSILNVALPTIARDFQAKVTGLQWALDAYQLVLATLLVLAGSLADRLGRRRVFRFGLLVFSLGSLLCSLAPGIGSLVVFRILQAVGGCMLTPVSLSIVRQVFTDPTERAKALGWWSAIYGLGVACGPALGGVLVAGIGWRSVFWVNVPVGLGAWVLAGLLVPESRAARPRRIDVPGQLLVMAGLAALTYAVIEGPAQGWRAAPVLVAFAAGIAAASALVVVEGRRAEPLLELRFFRGPPFSAANGIAVINFLALSGFLFINTLYLQQVRGDSALVAGLAVAPATLMMVAVAPFSGRLVADRGPRIPLILAGLCLAAGAAILYGLTPSTTYSTLALAYVLLGAGFGLVNPPITSTAVTGLPAAQAGVAGAIASTARQTGNTLGVAIMGSMIANSGVGANGLTTNVDQFLALTRAPWLLVVGCGFACSLLAAVCTGPRGQRIATRVTDSGH